MGKRSIKFKTLERVIRIIIEQVDPHRASLCTDCIIDAFYPEGEESLSEQREELRTLREQAFIKRFGMSTDEFHDEEFAALNSELDSLRVPGNLRKG